MSENNQSTSSGIGIGGLLTVVFITLKLCHVINWSWWWVLAPSLIPLAIFLIALVIFGLIALLAALK